MNRLSCTGCGGRVEVPVGHTRAKIRCETCGYYVEVPESLRGGVAAEEQVEAKPKPKKDKLKERAPPPPALVGSQDEDDGQPYGVPGDLTRRCEACFRDIEYDAKFCIHCGTDFQAGKKAKKTYQPIDETHEERFPRALRWKVFAGLQFLNLFFAILLGKAIDASLEGIFMFLVMKVGLQAFIVGSYSSVSIKRTSKGAATLSTRMFIAFIPLAPKKVEWKESAGVGIISIHQPGFLEWITFIYLILCLIVPGVVFYFFVIRPERFHISLCDVYGSTNEIIFRTTDYATAEAIAKTIHTATGLWYRPVL